MVVFMLVFYCVMYKIGGFIISFQSNLMICNVFWNIVFVSFTVLKFCGGREWKGDSNEMAGEGRVSMRVAG